MTSVSTRTVSTPQGATTVVIVDGIEYRFPGVSGVSVANVNGRVTINGQPIESFNPAGGGGGADDVEPAIPAGHPPRLGQATSTASASTRVVAQGGGGGGARGVN
ncbi:ABC transporter [Micractinium conductrix]|uniref:ABC transporter n=1 Tax=Micractinium conductrix TaxID=554055 RepID=A0A2P6VED8_9CHLO|nr:ABC transporter [Micractinium conductrix]|eukprot:PSC72456.1 ABC transporter [Micractinium conductrix]